MKLTHSFVGCLIAITCSFVLIAAFEPPQKNSSEEGTITRKSGQENIITLKEQIRLEYMATRYNFAFYFLKKMKAVITVESYQFGINRLKRKIQFAQYWILEWVNGNKGRKPYVIKEGQKEAAKKILADMKPQIKAFKKICAEYWNLSKPFNNTPEIELQQRLNKMQSKPWQK